MYQFHNPNPKNFFTDDCNIRAVSVAFNMTWDEAYVELTTEGYILKDNPNSKRVVNSYLKRKWWVRKVIPNTCPDCYTVKDFVKDHYYGTYILATENHLIPVIDGTYYDIFDSGLEAPIYYWERD